MNRRPNRSSYNRSPEAPEDPTYSTDEDYPIAEFEDLNDEDTIYVRWSAPHQRAYMYSELDRQTQWAHKEWTIRKTIEVGLGMGQIVDEYDFDIPSTFVIVHNEMLDETGNPTMDTLNPDNDVDWIQVETILNRTWDSYGANNIMLMFNVR